MPVSEVIVSCALHDLDVNVDHYLTADWVRPDKSTAYNHACRRYKCIRCASRFCSKKCLGVHTETRCLKFLA